MPRKGQTKRKATIGDARDPDSLKAHMLRFSQWQREKAYSERTVENREAALDFVREGDALVVTRLDRPARSTADLLGIVEALEAKQVALPTADELWMMPGDAQPDGTDAADDVRGGGRVRAGDHA